MVAKKKQAKAKKEKVNFDLIIHTLIVAIVIIFLVNLIFTFSITNKFNERIDNLIEEQRPADISLTVINIGCSNCQSIQTVVDAVKSSNVNILNELILNSQDAVELINKYNIGNLPTVIVTGETNKTNLNGFVESGDALIYDNIALPHYSVAQNRVVGEVNAVIINPENCEKCYNAGFLTTQLKQSGIAIIKTEIKTQLQSQKEIQELGIKKLPVVIFSEDMKEYQSIAQAWNEIGFIKNNKYVAVNFPPPYFDIVTSQIKGLVKVIYIADKSCKTCYNVTNHRLILQRAGIEIGKEQTVDITSAEGKQLLTKYKITKVPTVMFSKDINDYESFIDVLLTVAEKQSDGNVVFTKPEVMGIHKDIVTNQIIIPER